MNREKFLVLHMFIAMISGAKRTLPNTDDYLAESESRMQAVIDILSVIKERDPEQFHLRDDDGFLPLHIALENKYSRTKSRDWLSYEYPSRLIQFLLNEHPESVRIPDGQGRLPLHIAAEYGIPCFQIIMDAETRALATRSPVTHMYPFQHVAYTDGVFFRAMPKLAAVDMTYTLLRKCPHVMNNFVGATTAKEPWIHSDIYKEILRNELKMAQNDYETFLKQQTLQAKNVKLEQELRKVRK